MIRILNLTQHAATAEQLAAGVIDPSDEAQAELQTLLTFFDLPSPETIRDRAEQIAEVAAAVRIKRAMIGGAPWLMAPLAAALRQRGVEPLFAFSVRETEEQTQPDGSVRKIAVFRHAGFVPAV
jgi:hypothetical protein